MKNLVIFYCLISILFTSCATAPKGIVYAEANYKEFTPIEAYPSNFANFYDDSGKLVSKPWRSMTNAEIRKILPNQKAEIFMRKLNTDGKISYLSGNFTAEKGDYIVTLDYMKYLVEDIMGKISDTIVYTKRVSTNDDIIGVARIGVGMRITARINTTSVGIDLGSLIAMGFAAKQNNLTGRLMVDVIGMDSPEITQLFPTPSTIDETSIQKALESIAAIKSKLSDSNTTLTPQIVAIKALKPDVSKEKIKQNLK